LVQLIDYDYGKDKTLYPDWEHDVGLLLHAGGLSIGGGCEEGRARNGGQRLLALVPHQDEAGGVND
jgi:hypothetical protein